MARQRVASRSELEDGDMRTVEVNGTQVLLVQVEGTIHALGAHCPHQFAPLGEGLLDGPQLLCPWHQSVFEVTSGELVEPPALEGLQTFPVTVEGDDVMVEVGEDAGPVRQPEVARRDPENRRTAVVLGGGAAGGAAVQELRRAGFSGRVVMITEDDRAPYDRTHCSKHYLEGAAPEEWLPLKPAAFWEQADIEKISDQVHEVDVRERVVRLPQGAVLTADVLLLAMGAQPNRLEVPGADLGGVHTLRTWRDADAIIGDADDARSAVVVGASFIGMEAASSLRGRGIGSVTVVAPEDIPFGRVLGERIGHSIQHLHEDNGVDFELGSGVAALVGDGSVREVELDDGRRLEAELVVVGIGVRPATDIVRGVELEADGSLLTDEMMRVAEGVFAAGDLATFPHRRTGRPTRIEHWRTAQQQGMVAARNMAGGAQPFHRVPFFWTMHFGVPMGYVGHAPQWDEIIMDGEPEEGDFIAFFVQEGRVMAAAAMGRDRQLNALHQLMQLERTPAPEEVRGGLDLTDRLGP